MKICQLCGNAIEFSSRAKKWCSEECRKRVKYEKDRAWAKANPDKVTAYARKWYADNRELMQQQGRDNYRAKCAAKMKEGTE